MFTGRNNHGLLLWVNNNSSFFANFLLTDSGLGSSSGIGMYYFHTVDCYVCLLNYIHHAVVGIKFVMKCYYLKW